MRNALVWFLIVGVLAGSLVLADYASNEYMNADGYLSDVSTDQATFNAMTDIWGLYAPADYGQVTATLYKGDRYVDSRNSGTLLDVDMYGIWHTANSTYSGDWQGVGWHYARWIGDNLTSTLSTYDPPTSNSASIQARHEEARSTAFGEYTKWLYFNPITSPYLCNSFPEKAVGVELDVVFQAKIIPEKITSGDYMPFLLVDPESQKALAVIERGTTGKYFVVVLSYDQAEGWSISREFSMETRQKKQ